MACIGSTCFVICIYACTAVSVARASILLKKGMASHLATGRPKASPVWDSFDYCEKDNRVSVVYLTMRMKLSAVESR